MKTEPGAPSNEYKRLVSAAPTTIDDHEVSAPKDMKQVENFQAAERKTLRISRDALYNLYLLAHTTNFIKELVFYPDLICIMFLDELWEKVRGLFNRKDIPHVCFQYDTTFNLGDVYVSVLVVQFKEMENAPVIPLMFMLHERKTNETHDFFFRKVAQHFSELVTANNIYVVTDEDKAFLNAIYTHLSDIDAFRCWNHLIVNAKFKLGKLGITSQDEVSPYVKDLRMLFQQKSREDYLALLNEIYSAPVRWHKVYSHACKFL